MSRKRPHKGSTYRGRGKVAARRSPTITGTFRVSQPGRASVETPEGTFRVPRGGVREALNGDEVQVSVFPGHGGERLARVQGVLQRATETLVGTFVQAGPLGVVTPLDERLGRDFYVLPEDGSVERLGVHDGDVVRARITEYPTRSSEAVVSLERRLGTADELDLGVESVIASHGLATEFPQAALEEAAALRVDVDAALSAEPARRDLRDELLVTVDPADARDFDDAVSACRLPDGGFELGVHIADVTHYVPWGGSVDNEAKRRTCSVYLVDRVLPMLPERLSDDVCSLRPHEDRLAMTVRMRLGASGEVERAEAYPSAIRSSARLSYDEVDAFLDGGPLPEGTADGVADLLRTLDGLRELRERVRKRRGAIDFETVESRVALDGDGRPTGVAVRMRTRATGLIEEAMLLANECVARMLADAEVACAYRVHERPAPESLRACVEPLVGLGLMDGVSTEALVAGVPAATRAVLEAARGTSREAAATALLLRAQKRAVYLPHNDGHYALGAPAYCHFTSPIRRYPDVIVHRALKAYLLGALGSREQREVGRALPQLCRTCSDQERVADSAARDSQKVKLAELYAGRLGEECGGTVSGCARHGVYVTLDDTYAEGLVPMRKLGSEWFDYDEAAMTLTGEETGEVWRLGRRVRVRVEDADPLRGRIGLSLLGYD